MDSISPEMYEMIARYLTGESNADESASFESMLKADPQLVVAFEYCKTLLLDDCDVKDIDTAKHFDRISRRLKGKGLI